MPAPSGVQDWEVGVRKETPRVSKVIQRSSTSSGDAEMENKKETAEGRKILKSLV
jgi:hypothetical protein